MDNETWSKAEEFYKNGNIDKAIKIYKDLYAKNDFYAAAAIGSIYETLDEENSMSVAVEWYQKAFEHNNDTEIALNLGHIFLYHFQNENDGYKKAYEYYSLDILAENHIALLNLGKMYFNAWGVKKNFNEAINFFRKSWLKGNIYAGLCLVEYYKKNGHWFTAFLFRTYIRLKSIHIYLKGNYEESLRQY